MTVLQTRATISLDSGICTFSKGSPGQPTPYPTLHYEHRGIVSQSEVHSQQQAIHIS